MKSTVRPWLSVSRPSSRICKQHVENVVVRLFDLVEEQHAVRPAAHGFGELAAFFVADITGRRADQPRDGVLLHVFAHVDANHVVLAVEEQLSQRAGQLGFADAGRAEENERTDRALGVFEAGAGADDRVGHGLHRFVLADDALVENLVQAKQFLLFAFEQAGDRNAGPAGDDFGDFVGRDFLLEKARAFLCRLRFWLRVL